MKLIRHGAAGAEKPGLVDAAGRCRDLSAHVTDFAGPALSKTALATLAGIDPQTLPLVPEGTRLGPPVAGTRNFIAVGMNYADHAAETGGTVPREPLLFSKAPNCISGPYDDILIPPGAAKLDWEVELAVVIGDTAWQVDEAHAFDHVAGFVLCNDVSERAFQMEGTGQWLKGKSAPTFGPLGPWLVTPDEIADVQKLSMELDLNGAPRQRGNTATMVFGVRMLVAYISRFLRLDPGDVITTGTPPGVGMGRKPPEFLKAGDLMRLSVEGLGEQRCRVSAG
ncbi:fumarylacetoacetate hydrolase family protein [Pleomorphomonas koreensis]|uniref:fumarylacetoacetate hydrolase family protein n=1 Tax=Pleomorphomonas koreensis TaxID=257440 RepID=UPI0003F58E02|nr:fumarylacetoacetate hydrolase family protein [Pleomorphomonas koreensis]